MAVADLKTFELCTDRKIELPHPGEQARTQILRIHSKRMNVDANDVNYEELARCTEDFNGAQLKVLTLLTMFSFTDCHFAGCVCGSRHDRFTTRGYNYSARRFHGGDWRCSSKEEGLTGLLRVTRSTSWVVKRAANH
jgi:hypothetical protein